MWSAVASGETKDYDAIAIVIDDDRLPTPCGACRQVLAEFAPSVRVVLATTAGKRKVTTLTELLPDPFLPENLRWPSGTTRTIPTIGEKAPVVTARSTANAARKVPSGPITP